MPTAGSLGLSSVAGVSVAMKSITADMSRPSKNGLSSCMMPPEFRTPRGVALTTL